MKYYLYSSVFHSLEEKIKFIHFHKSLNFGTYIKIEIFALKQTEKNKCNIANFYIKNFFAPKKTNCVQQF